MRDTVIKDMEHLGGFKHKTKLAVGDTQSMTFKKGD